MPQTGFQNIVFTVIMATCMVYGMICYNITLALGSFTPNVFLMAFDELPIMVAIAFVLEFFIVGKLAGMLAFKFVTPESGSLKITIAISICICLIMCPLMSGIATILFNSNPSFTAFLMTYIANLPMALGLQLLICGPLVRRIFRLLFRNSLASA